METHEEKPNSVRDAILSKIDSKEISMHAKGYFTWRAAATIAVAVAALLVSASIFNFIFFNIRLNHQGDLLMFGPQGFWLFLKLFPWLFLAIDIALIVLLEWLLRKFRFGYAVPALYLLIGLLFVAAVLGFIIDRGTPLNDHLLEQADNHGLPQPINGFYENFRQPPPRDHRVCDCVITAIDGNIVTAYQKNDPASTVTITVPPNDPTLAMLSAGDSIFAAGDFHDGTLHTFGIRKTDDAQASPAQIPPPSAPQS